MSLITRFVFLGYLPLINSTDKNALLNSGIFLHDPVSFVALVRPDLFKYKKGVVRVETQGICIGHTLMDQGLKKYVLPHYLTSASLD